VRVRHVETEPASLNDEFRTDRGYMPYAARHLDSALLLPSPRSAWITVELNKSPCSYKQSDPPLVIVPPEPVDDFDLDQISHIVIKLFPMQNQSMARIQFRPSDSGSGRYSHHKVYIEQEVEIPALLDHGIA
jgi:hypothetical protein